MIEEILSTIPITFTEVVATVTNFALETFEGEITQKQLYYHTYTHVIEVKHRARQIFEILRPYLQVIESNNLNHSEAMARMELLLDLCAVAHDMIQIFVPQTQPHTSRRREAGVSEIETIEQLLAYIKKVNQKIQQDYPQSNAVFTVTEMAIIEEAIAATICDYDPEDQAIYQPALYNYEKLLSPISLIIPLADIGTLGSEGIVAYNREGSLIFLEDNLDIIPFINQKKFQTLLTKNPELYENFRQRLLKRARFQVNLAKSRLKRYLQELAGFPPESIPRLKQAIFPYLNEETIEELAAITPTDEETSLETLIEFFELEKILNTKDFLYNS